MYVLYGRAGWGSAIVEAQLAWYGLPYRFVAVADLFADAGERERLAPINPLAQIPTLVLPDGAVMTESAAITLLFADGARERASERDGIACAHPSRSVPLSDRAIQTSGDSASGHRALVPPPGAAMRPAFLRWLVFLVANLYPTFTYADDPARFVAVEAAQAPFRAAVDAYAARLWHIIEGAASAPWFLGETMSALDIYLAVMTHWRPRRAWFSEHCPRVAAIAARADVEPGLAEVWRSNFPDGRTSPE